MPPRDPGQYAFLTQAQKRAQDPPAQIIGNQPQFASNASPVTVLSSPAGKDEVEKDISQLQNIESTYTVQPGDTLSGIAKEKGVKTEDISGYRSGDPNLIYPGEQLTLRAPQGNPALASMARDVSETVGTADLTSEQRQGLTNLTTLQDGIVSSAAAARAALDNGDYSQMDFYTKRAEELQKQYLENLSEYYKQIQPLRERRQKLLNPTEREKELSKSLVSIRNQIDQFNLQTEEDKLREFEGQTLSFARGRAAAIDIKAEFKRSRMALEEKNLLLSLGLEQEAREMEKKSLDEQLSYIREDFELQEAIQEKLTAQENELIEQANELRTEAKNSLGTILDMLDGVNPNELDAQTRVQLEALSAQAGLPYEIVEKALETQYAREQYEQAVEDTKEKQDGEDEVSTESTSGFSPVTQQVIDGFTSIDELTPSQSQKVRDDLYAAGFNSDTPPEWFREYIQEELRQTLTPNALQEEWIQYRDKILGGGGGELDFDNL